MWLTKSTLIMFEILMVIKEGKMMDGERIEGLLARVKWT